MKIDEYGMPAVEGSGGGGGGADVSGVTATAGDVAADKKFVTADGTLTDGTLAAVTEPAPTLSLNSSTGVVTATYTPVAGLVKDTSAKSGTLQLTTQGATTITPGSSAQTITAGKFLTGDITVAAVTPSGGGNTVLLMHFNSDLSRDGALADAGIVAQRINGMDAEMGGSGENWAPAYDTGHFGNALVFPPGADEWDYYNHQLVLPVSGELVIDDFTVEFWYVNTTGYDNNGLLIKTSGVGHIIEFMARGAGSTQTVDVRLGNGSSWVVDKGGGGAVSPTTTSWHHVALVRYNDVFTCYIDGAVYWSQSCGTITSVSGNAMLQIGSLSTRFEGLIDELRVSNIARYTAAFTPPGSAFVVD